MPTPRSVLLSRPDIDFLLFEWLDASGLTRRSRYAGHDTDTFRDALDLAERMAAERFAPHNRRNDVEEPTFDGERIHIHEEVAPALRAFAEAGFVGASLPTEVGGMALPHLVASACFAWFQAANISTSAYVFLTTAAANLLLAHGTLEQIDAYVPPMIEGRFFGTMCLSEPHAGSSLADISTRAEPQPDGTYRLFGSKMWISGGDHDLAENIVHLVLAKVPGAPAGVKGISLFAVPKLLVARDGSLGERNDIALVGLNHKMGYRGTTNALLNFGEGKHLVDGSAGAVGSLVGERERGLAAMFHMMNEARVGVGLAACAVGYTAYLKSLAYARSRRQGRPLAGGDRSGPQVPLVDHPDVRRLLVTQKAYVEGALALSLYCSRLLDDENCAESSAEREGARILLDVLTPVAKSWPSQWCLRANSLAIQVHGGYGYTRDYDVEQHYRDNRLNAIHEGTHGIQALDLLGRRMRREGGAGLAELVRRMEYTIERARALPDSSLNSYADQLSLAASRVRSVTLALTTAGDRESALANASAYLEAVGHVVVAWLWLDQLVTAHGRSGEFFAGKRAAAGYFFGWELPRTRTLFDLLESMDRSAWDFDPQWL